METTYPSSEQPTNKNSNKIYFLIAVIVALLGTNAYLFFKDKKSNDRVITLSDEKSRMETEIDKIEAELDKSNSANVELSAKMQQEQESARQRISELRSQLKKGQLTQAQLAKAQEDVKQLRYFVTKYNADIEQLKKENAMLTVERDSLQTTVSTVRDQATNLEKQNVELNSKVKVASALKASVIGITPVRVRSNGKESSVTRANTTDKFKIAFNVVDNTIADKGMHDVFVRIIDPRGNLIIGNDSSLFNADGEEAQYTYKTAIEFANDGKLYQIDWSNPNDFQKGAYTVVLYADGYTMGKTTVTLK